jgi:HPt (histidine-containing phosphotransfer) domain-containing protein
MEVSQDDWLKELTASALNVEMPSAPTGVGTVTDPGLLEPVVDLKALKRLKLMIGSSSAALLDELVEILEREALRLIPQMLEAVRKADAAQLEYAAHTFKGSSFNLGLSRLVSLSRKLELMGRAGDLADAERLVVQVAAAYQEALPALKNVLDDLPA